MTEVFLPVTGFFLAWGAVESFFVEMTLCESALFSVPLRESRMLLSFFCLILF